MPQRISKRPSDINQAAFVMVERSTAESEPLQPKPRGKLSPTVSRIMSAMGRKGGRIGGKRRLETMTPEERSQVAMRAAKARWEKKK